MRETKAQPISETRFNRSEAAQKYLEQYGDPIVTNTYLKLPILILPAVPPPTLSVFSRSQSRFEQREAARHPYQRYRPRRGH